MADGANKWRIWLLLVAMTACTKTCSKSHEDMDPEEVLEAYLELSFNISDASQKEQLMSYTTGVLKEALAGTTDSVFLEAFRPRQLQSFWIEQVDEITPRLFTIKFGVIYTNTEVGKTKMVSAEIRNSTTITLERIASNDKKTAAWYISEVSGAKTSINFPTTSVEPVTPQGDTSPNSESATGDNPQEGDETEMSP